MTREQSVTGFECKGTRKSRNIFLFLDVHSITNYGAIAGVGIIGKKRRKDWRNLWTVFPNAFVFSSLFPTPSFKYWISGALLLDFQSRVGAWGAVHYITTTTFSPTLPLRYLSKTHNKRTSFTSISEGGTKLVTGNQYQSPGPRNALISSVCGFPFLENGLEHRKFYDNC